MNLRFNFLNITSIHCTFFRSLSRIKFPKILPKLLKKPNQRFNRIKQISSLEPYVQSSLLSPSITSSTVLKDSEKAFFPSTSTLPSSNEFTSQRFNLHNDVMTHFLSFEIPELSIEYEDDDFIFVNKPPGQILNIKTTSTPFQPAGAWHINYHDSFYHHVKTYCFRYFGFKTPLSWHIENESSGLSVFPKNHFSESYLRQIKKYERNSFLDRCKHHIDNILDYDLSSEIFHQLPLHNPSIEDTQFQSPRYFKHIYLALVHNSPPLNWDKYYLPFKKQPNANAIYVKIGSSFEHPLFGKLSLIAMRIDSIDGVVGLPHQIRRICYNLGTPLLCSSQDENCQNDLPFQFLHSAYLSFRTMGGNNLHYEVISLPTHWFSSPHLDFLKYYCYSFFEHMGPPSLQQPSDSNAINVHAYHIPLQDNRKIESIGFPNFNPCSPKP